MKNKCKQTMGARHKSRVTLAIDQIDRKVKTHNGHMEIIEYLTQHEKIRRNSNCIINPIISMFEFEN